MSKLSELIPAGGSAKELSAVASGTLPNGQAVILKDNGQIEVVAGSDGATGNKTVFEAATTRYISSAYDTNTNRVVIAYADSGNSSHGTAIVGTVSGTGISFGSAVVFESAEVQDVSVTFDSNSNKIVIAYADEGNSSHGTAIVGTVSGTAISFGSAVVFESANTGQIEATFDNNLNKVVIVYTDNANSYFGTAIVGTVSGTGISFGGAAVFESAGIGGLKVSFDSGSNKIVIVYQDQGNSNYGTAIIGTVSGTSISFGTAVVFLAANNQDNGVPIIDTNNNKVIISFKDAGNSGYGTSRVGTISGTGISFGTAVVFNSGNTHLATGQSYDPNIQKAVIGYRDDGDSNIGKYVVGTVSGTSISFESEINFSTGRADNLSLIYDPDSANLIMSFEDFANSNNGTSLVFSPTTSNLTSTNFVGFASKAISSGATGVINPVGGVAASVSNIAIPTSIPDGSSVTYTSARAENNTVAFDPSDSTKFVVAYRDNASAEGRASVGSISGNSISFGTAVKFTDGGAQMDSNAISFDPNQTGRFVIAHNATVGAAQKGHVTVGTRSGTNLSFGTSVQIFNSSMVLVSCEFDPQVSGKFLLNWGDSANNLLVGTLSGTTLSFGTLVTLSGTYNQPNLAVDPINAGKYVISYQDGADSDHGYAAVVTVVGTTPSRGTPVKFLSAACESPHVVYDSGVSNAFVIVFVDAGDSNKAKAVAGVVSGTSLSFGSIITYNATSSASTYIAADPNTTGSFVAISDDGTALVTLITRSGTNTVTAGESYVIYNAANENGAIEFNPSNSKKGQFVFVTEDRSASPYKGTSVLGQTPSTGSILTIGSTYYVQSDGTVSTVSTSPAVNAGKAISATSLLLKG